MTHLLGMTFTQGTILLAQFLLLKATNSFDS